MKKNKLIALITLVLLPVTSYAGKWTDWQKVHIVYAYNNGIVYFALKANHKHINDDGCNSNSYLILRKNNASYDQIYKMALTAKASDRQFRVYLSGCSGNYPTIQHAMMR